MKRRRARRRAGGNGGIDQHNLPRCMSLTLQVGLFFCCIALRSLDGVLRPAASLERLDLSSNLCAPHEMGVTTASEALLRCRCTCIPLRTQRRALTTLVQQNHRPVLADGWAIRLDKSPRRQQQRRTMFGIGEIIGVITNVSTARMSSARRRRSRAAWWSEKNLSREASERHHQLSYRTCDAIGAGLGFGFVRNSRIALSSSAERPRDGCTATSCQPACNRADYRSSPDSRVKFYEILRNQRNYSRKLAKK